MKANYHAGRVCRGNQLIEVRRGQVFTSKKALAARWRWDRKTVTAFLDALRADDMLDIQTSKQTDTGYTLLSILNFEKYQGGDQSGLGIGTDTQGDIGTDIDSPSSPHPLPTSKKLKKEKKESTTTVVSLSSNHSTKALTPDVDPLAGFAEFWSGYPKRVARKDAIKAWKKLAPANGLVATIVADVAARAKSEWLRDNGKYVPHPATYLNGRRWEDEGVQVEDPAEKDPYADFEVMYDCRACGEAHPTKTCSKRPAGVSP
jgi:hypothetical protein